jgi:hypothetical protein
MKKTIEVPVEWFERLLEIADEMKKLNNKKKKPITALAKLSQLLGYISSAKYIIKQSPNRE